MMIESRPVRISEVCNPVSAELDWVRSMVDLPEGMFVITAVLAASDRPTEQAVRDALLWAAVVVVVLAFSAIALSAMRRRFRERASNAEQSLTLQDIRRLRDTGRISTAEYERLARTVAESTLGIAGRSGRPRDAR